MTFLRIDGTAVEGRSASEVKTDIGLGNVEDTALSTWAGSTNVTTLGTIATGTWEGTTVAVDQGGTGQTSYTNGQLLIGNTTGNTLDKSHAYSWHKHNHHRRRRFYNYSRCRWW